MKSHPPLRASIGLVALVAVILSWVAFIAIGFALIYFSDYPQQFITTPAPRKLDVGSRLLRSLYLSIGTLDTFQTFDISPHSDWLRLVISLEGLIDIFRRYAEKWDKSAVRDAASEMR